MSDTVHRSPVDARQSREDRLGSTAVADSTEGDGRDLVIIEELPAEGRAQLDAAVERLRRTFDSGRTRDVDWRRGQLRALLTLLEEHEDDLERALHEDLGRPPLEAFSADIGTTRAEVSYLLKHVGAWAKPKRVLPNLTGLPGMGRLVPEPLGVALVIAPWNYPVQLLLAPLAAAVAAGNCVVAKPSEMAPAVSATLARLLPRYLDTDAVTVVEGGVPETTALLDRAFDHIFFTGSTSVGRVVMQAAARHLTPVVLELGGKSPTIVARDADLDVAAHRIMWGKHLNAGQTCIAPDYVLVEEPVRDALVERMGAAVREFLGTDPQTSRDYARIVNDRHFRRLSRLLDTAGGTVAVGGPSDPGARFISPTIIVDPDLDAPIMQEEIFGPLLPVISVPSIPSAVRFVNERPKPLALYVFSSSDETVDRVIGETSSGGACVNHTLLHYTLPGLPFGGVGPSGMGAYHGRASFDAFTHYKSVLHKPVRPDLRFLYPPYTKLKDRLIRSAM